MNSPQISQGPEPPAGLPPCESPDAWVFLTDDSGKITAHAALWWKETPLLEGQRIGTIGAFSATSPESAAAILAEGCALLRDRACITAVGPMNGNTWQPHRFVTESDGRGPYLLEPRNPPAYPEWWEQAGFTVLSRYSSSVMSLDGTEATTPAFRERLRKSGVHIRTFDLSRFDEELAVIHCLSLDSFSRNFLYTPQDETAFIRAYRKVKDAIDPDFVRIAERGGQPCGFAFGIEDKEALARGEKPALIVKTLAVDPSSRSAGLGSMLVDELHQAAREKGLVEAIHAMQHESNSSLKITGRHHGNVFRRYALFSQLL